MEIEKHCKVCYSTNIVMNGFTSAGKQKYHCKNCGCYRTLNTKQYYSDERKAEILKAYKERSSLRGIHRIYGVSVPTIISWLKKKSRV